MARKCPQCGGYLNITDHGGRPRYQCPRKECGHTLPLVVKTDANERLERENNRLRQGIRDALQRERRAREAADGLADTGCVVRLGEPLAELLAVRRVAGPGDVKKLERIAKGGE